MISVSPPRLERGTAPVFPVLTGPRGAAPIQHSGRRHGNAEAAEEKDGGKDFSELIARLPVHVDGGERAPPLGLKRRGSVGAAVAFPGSGDPLGPRPAGQLSSGRRCRPSKLARQPPSWKTENT